VPPPGSGPKAKRDTAAPGASSRGKRDEILWTATAYFGENGYEATKLADVAAAVGIGSTALYHYFDSKLHCLYVIMADALAIVRSDSIATRARTSATSMPCWPCSVAPTT
jgi:AcrR family transcriptional regulator